MEIFLLIIRRSLLLLMLFLAACVPNPDFFIEPFQLPGHEYQPVDTIILDWPFTWVQDVYLMNDTVLVRASLPRPFELFFKWIAFDVHSREKIWSLNGGAIRFYPPLAFAYDDQNLYSGRHLSSIDMLSGEIQWEQTATSPNSIAISDELLFFGDKYVIKMYNKDSGELLSSSDIGFRPVTFYDPDRNWFVAFSDEYISLYDGSTGDLINSFENKNLFVCGAQELMEYWDGKLYCLDKYLDLSEKYLFQREFEGQIWLSEVQNNTVFLMKDKNLIAYDLSEQKIIWEKSFFAENQEEEQVIIRSKVYTFDLYGAVITSDSYSAAITSNTRLRLFSLADGKDISENFLQVFAKRNFDYKSIMNFPHFIAANDQYVIIAFENSRLSIYEKIDAE